MVKVKLMGRNIKSLINKSNYMRQFIDKNTISYRFKSELALIRDRIQVDSDVPSILHFSHNKAATQYVKRVLRSIAKDQGLLNIDLNGYAFRSNFPFLDQLSEQELKKYQYIFKSKGVLYSVFGGPIRLIENLDKFKVIYMVRDPRDILVSNYYSIAFSHGVPTSSGDKYADFMKRREEAKNMSIDDFALGKGEELLSRFQQYKKHLTERHNHVLTISYEEMISDFGMWLAKILDYLEITISSKTLGLLNKEYSSKKSKHENIMEHNRKGIVGDYKNKLTPRVIRSLNDTFSEFL